MFFRWARPHFELLHAIHKHPFGSRHCFVCSVPPLRLAGPLSCVVCGVPVVESVSAPATVTPCQLLLCAFPCPFQGTGCAARGFSPAAQPHATRSPEFHSEGLTNTLFQIETRSTHQNISLSPFPRFPRGRFSCYSLYGIRSVFLILLWVSCWMGSCYDVLSLFFLQPIFFPPTIPSSPSNTQIHTLFQIPPPVALL